MKLKRLCCLGLAVSMLCGVLAGCGDKSASKSSYKDDANKEVTLVMALPKPKQADADEVVAEINKKLETLLPNTKLDIMFEGDMAQKWANWMAISKKIDIAHSGYVTDIEAEVEKKTYISLDELVEEYAPTLQKHSETYWYTYDSGKVGGKLYAIPNVQILTQDLKVINLGSIRDYLDEDALQTEAWSNDKTTEKFWQILDEAMDKAVANGSELKGKIGLPWYKVAKKGYQFIGGENSNLCYDMSDSGTIIDFYTTDEFKTFCKYMKKWAEKGYVSPDVVSIANSAIGATSKSSCEWDEENNVITSNTFNQFVYEDPSKTVLTNNKGYTMTYWSIPYTSENPARAIKFLNLLHSEEGAEIANLLAYGIEGKHYEVVNEESGDIRAFEYQGQGGSNVSYGIPSWIVTNGLEGMYTVEPYTYEATKKPAEEYYNEKLNQFKKHILYDLEFDLTSVKTKLSNVLKNNAEIAPNVYTGVTADTDALYDELMNKNKAAGIEDIIKDLQKQVDEYLANQK